MKYSCQKITLIWTPFKAFEDNLQCSCFFSTGLSVYMAGHAAIIYIKNITWNVDLLLQKLPYGLRGFHPPSTQTQSRY